MLVSRRPAIVHRVASIRARRAPAAHAFLPPPPNKSGSFSELVKDIEADRVQDAVVSQGTGKVTYTVRGQEERVDVVLPRGNSVVEALLEHDVPVMIEPPGNPPDVLGMFGVFFELVLLGIFIRMLITRNQAAGGGGSQNIFGFGKAVTKEVEPDQITTRFDDVAGVEAAKQDLQEVVDFLKNPERYARVGAKIPKGILLIGSPGTGKTLLAKAVAGEAGVPFFECSASSFVEMFVGTGAARVRDLFLKAKSKAPCIVFIDEIDAIGKTRSSGASSNSNDEREQTINQLLTAMDGFQDNSGVIVLAATNRPDILDDALLRPGRFDRKVTVELPDLRGRTAILGIHTANKPLASSVDLTAIARNTVGFSGADLANLANEAAIYAARDDAPDIARHHWDKALEKVTIGEERPSLIVTDHKRRVTAYHEAGHALLGLLMSDFDVVRKVTIVPRGQTGGVTYFAPSDERVDSGLVSRTFLENQIIVSLGGRVAEEIVFGTLEATTGAQGDFEAVMEIAYHMVAAYGFNETLGPISWKNCPVDVSGDIASEMKFIVDRCYEVAHHLMSEHEFYLHRIAEALLEKETLDEEDLRRATVGLAMPIETKNEDEE
jgi:cell division protease FtsH